jgi:hypothetical protein
MLTTMPDTPQDAIEYGKLSVGQFLRRAPLGTLLSALVFIVTVSSTVGYQVATRQSPGPLGSKSPEAPVQVRLDGVDVISDVCKGDNPYYIKERYTMISPGDPTSFVMFQGITSQTFESWRSAPTLQIDSVGRGWTVNYCVWKTYSSQQTRRFFNPATGELSNPVVAIVKTP